DRAIKLVCPGCIRKNALDTDIHFRRSLRLAEDPRKATGSLLSALRKILSHVVKNLSPTVSGCLAPATSLASRFNRVANVFAITKGRLAEKRAVGSAHFHAVARIWTSLLPSDVELHGAINRRHRKVGMLP